MVLHIRITQLKAEQVLKGLEERFIEMEIGQFILFVEQRGDSIVNGRHGNLGDDPLLMARSLCLNVTLFMENTLFY